MTTYREKLEVDLIAELRSWLDSVEDNYGPTFALEAYGFIGAVGFTPDGEEPADHDSFSRSAIGFHFSDSRQWAQIGILRKALEIAERDD